MSNPHGTFIWYELLTPDAEAAKRFYADVVGWTASDMPGVGFTYHILSAGEAGVAGMMQLPPGEAGAQPGWLGYVGVDDVDSAVAAAERAGGSVVRPATDLPGVGRMALMADPQGALFHVMRGASERDSEAFDQNADGHCSWNELATSDMPGALDFYTQVFGWTKGDAMPMGPMGDYQFIDHGGKTIGAMMTRRPDGPQPMWSFYFRVPDIDAAGRRAAAAGGAIRHGPAEVPGGDAIVIASDPQGALFALVGKRAS